MPFSNPMAQMIAQHWENNFPQEADSLKQAGQFETAAEAAADRGSNVMSEALAKGKSWTEAKELEVQEWGTPPNK